MARGYLRWSIKELADQSGVSESTIKAMEAQDGFPGSRGANIEAVYRTLLAAGIVFLQGNGVEPGIAVRKPPAEPASTAKRSAGAKARPKKMPPRRSQEWVGMIEAGAGV